MIFSKFLELNPSCRINYCHREIVPFIQSYRYTLIGFIDSSMSYTIQDDFHPYYFSMENKNFNFRFTLPSEIIIDSGEVMSLKDLLHLANIEISL